MYIGVHATGVGEGFYNATAETLLKNVWKPRQFHQVPSAVQSLEVLPAPES